MICTASHQTPRGIRELGNDSECGGRVAAMYQKTNLQGNIIITCIVIASQCAVIDKAVVVCVCLFGKCNGDEASFNFGF